MEKQALMMIQSLLLRFFAFFLARCFRDDASAGGRAAGSNVCQGSDRAARLKTDMFDCGISN
jgi:hypothetical protein